MRKIIAIFVTMLLVLNGFVPLPIAEAKQLPNFGPKLKMLEIVDKATLTGDTYSAIVKAFYYSFR